jgi:hypothetical protein
LIGDRDGNRLGIDDHNSNYEALPSGGPPIEGNFRLASSVKEAEERRTHLHVGWRAFPSEGGNECDAAY